MPIVRASSGGLAHVIFNLPSRITIRGHINPFRRDAKLKMLCLTRTGGGQTWTGRVV
jgi:hypothetical protein